jgi:hypothetical protein
MTTKEALFGCRWLVTFFVLGMLGDRVSRIAREPKEERQDPHDSGLNRLAPQQQQLVGCLCHQIGPTLHETKLLRGFQ